MCKDKPEFFGNSLGIVNDCLHFKKLFEYGRNLFVCQDFGFCQDFVSMEKDKKFRSLEVREASSSHLKINKLKGYHFILRIEN